ncbi:MAG: hypothetical protein ACREO5_02635 [Candidatus Binatia bacterium]
MTNRIFSGTPPLSISPWWENLSYKDHKVPAAKRLFSEYSNGKLCCFKTKTTRYLSAAPGQEFETNDFGRLVMLVNDSV